MSASERVSPARIAALGIAGGIASFVALVPAAVAGTSDVKSFRAVKVTPRMVAFRVGALEPDSIQHASAKVRVAYGDRVERITRTVSVAKVRNVVDGGRLLRVRTESAVSSRSTTGSGRVRGGKLKVVTADTTPPETTITSGPSGTITSTDPSFTFESSESGSSFECRLDGWTSWAACSSPRTFSDLSSGNRTVSVRAKDAAGNVDPTPAERSFTVETSSEPPPPPPPPPPDCAVDARTMTAAGCALVKADTASQADPVPLWRSLECASASRYRHQTVGGDPAPTALGQSQGNSAYRQLTVLDGDDFYGERCELGKNNHTDTFQTYREGQRRITFASFRLPSNYPTAYGWHQSVLQIKQANPSNNSGGTPALSLLAVNDGWQLTQSDSPGPSGQSAPIWSTPSQKAVWTRMALDITYSQDPGLGRIKLYIDINGDGDATDPGEQSPEIRTHTLKYETAGASTAIPVGDSIPSHLRVGQYRSRDWDCPTGGCTVDIDNVEVVRP